MKRKGGGRTELERRSEVERETEGVQGGEKKYGWKQSRMVHIE